MKTCFGAIYPDLTQFQLGQELAGKVFCLKVNSLGPCHRDRRLQVDVEQWQQCQSCELFRSCYDLSNAKLMMQQAAAAI